MSTTKNFTVWTCVISYWIKFLHWNNSPDFSQFWSWKTSLFRYWLDFCLSLCFKVFKIELMFIWNAYKLMAFKSIKEQCEFYYRHPSSSPMSLDRKRRPCKSFIKGFGSLPWTITSPYHKDSSEHWVTQESSRALCLYRLGPTQCAKGDNHLIRKPHPCETHSKDHAHTKSISLCRLTFRNQFLHTNSVPCFLKGAFSK